MIVVASGRKHKKEKFSLAVTVLDVVDAEVVCSKVEF